MNLTEAKDQVAQKHGHKTFADLLTYMAKMYNTDHPEYVPDIMLVADKAYKLYASEKVKEALQLAAERAGLRHSYELKWGKSYLELDPESILSLETELLNQIKKEI